MKNIVNLLSILLLLMSCNADRNTTINFYDFNYDYELRSYYPTDLDNHIRAQFFLNGRLVRRTDREGGCESFHYNSNGKLTEKRWGRNCDNGIRIILLYDSLDNHIGYFSTRDSVVLLDTIQIEQIFFYDTENRLIRERTYKGKDVYGKKFETWKHYTYTDSLIKTETTFRNNHTLWMGEYFYDSNNNLTKIHRVRNDVYETEFFKYNKNGLLVEKEIISTENPGTPETGFSAGNNKKTYEYDSDGVLKTETVLNHKGKVEVKTIYKKLKKENKGL